MDKNQTIGELVRRERKARKLTQLELGELSGTGINFISQLERHKQTVRFDKLLEVLKVLGIEIQLKRGRAAISTAKELN